MSEFENQEKPAFVPRKKICATTQDWLNREASDEEKAVTERIVRKAKELLADTGKAVGELPAEFLELRDKLYAFVNKL